MECPPKAKTQADIYQEADTVLLSPLLQLRKLGLSEAKSPSPGDCAGTRIQAIHLQSPCNSRYTAKERADEKLVFPNPPSPPNPTGGERERDPYHGRWGGSFRVGRPISQLEGPGFNSGRRDSGEP